MLSERKVVLQLLPDTELPSTYVPSLLFFSFILLSSFLSLRVLHSSPSLRRCRLWCRLFFFSRSLSLAYALSALCLSPFSRFALCVLGCGLSVFVVVVCSVPVLMSSHLAFGPLRDGWMGGVLCGGHIYWNTHTHTHTGQ